LRKTSLANKHLQAIFFAKPSLNPATIKLITLACKKFCKNDLKRIIIKKTQLFAKNADNIARGKHAD